MPSPIATNLASLRHLLAERFPAAHTAPAERTRLATGLASIDHATGGGLPSGTLTELVCSAPSCGSHLLLGQLLAITRGRRQRVSLIDPADGFDPESFPSGDLEHLVWSRGCDTATALAITDLFARDANLHLTVLDLRHAPLAELRRTPATLWYRLQRAVETTDMVLLVMTPRALVPSAGLRLELATSLPLATLETARPDLCARLAPAIKRHRRTPRSATA